MKTGVFLTLIHYLTMSDCLINLTKSDYRINSNGNTSTSTSKLKIGDDLNASVAILIPAWYMDSMHPVLALLPSNNFVTTNELLFVASTFAQL